MKKQIKSFELVLIGHPDKICDLVSKTICEQNPLGRNAIECVWGNKLFTVNGETDNSFTDHKLSVLVKNVLSDVGLTEDELKIITVVNNLNIQSPEINKIVGDQGTGDNGIYFGGYNKIYSPVIAKMKDLCSALTANVLREWGYRTDGKFIFNVDKFGKIVDLTINVAKNKDRKVEPENLIEFIKTFTGTDTVVTVNPKGDWSKCYAFADCGLTGRKLACDGACGLFSHGGGAMFGKDISKADVTVPLYLSYLAERFIGRKKEVGFSAASIIGDKELDVYRNGKFYESIPFAVMKAYVRGKELDVFGVLRDSNK